MNRVNDILRAEQTKLEAELSEVEAQNAKLSAEVERLEAKRVKLLAAEHKRYTYKHTWIEVGKRRWCTACGSYQVKQGKHWVDSMVGTWPGYNSTDEASHGDK